MEKNEMGYATIVSLEAFKQVIDEAEFGSNLMSISTTGWIGWRNT
jgi:hypothetical protein